MASHFKWYPSSEEVIVPFNARYSFPSQANKAVKITPRIPPKTGSTFTPGSIVRVEFPAQGYVNPQNTTLEFDVTLSGFDGKNLGGVWFQNNIQSIFSRVRLLYGATPLEDIINYSTIVRSLTEWTSTNQLGCMDQTSIAEGIGGTVMGAPGLDTPWAYFTTGKTLQGVTVSSGVSKPVHVRRNYIQGLSYDKSIIPSDISGGKQLGVDPNEYLVPTGKDQPGQGEKHAGQISVTRRYQINFALGLFTQDKLIPAKFMASQLAIELTLAQPTACIIAIPSLATAYDRNKTNQEDYDNSAAGAAILSPASNPNSPTYSLSNVNLIPEILEFDASYDAMFLKGLREGGVPIKFSSWHTFIFSNGESQTLNLLIQERSRSVKSIFAMVKRAPSSFLVDSGATHFATMSNSGTTSLLNYQYRIGGRYFPASPVQLATSGSGAANGYFSNGGAEGLIELQKSLNTMGDYRLSASLNTNRWALQPSKCRFGWKGFSSSGDSNDVYAGETDYNANLLKFSADGSPYVTYPGMQDVGPMATGNMGSACFTMATNLETSSGMEISGLNAEEQSDISLIANYSDAQSDPNGAKFNVEVYCFYDAMLILRENNVLELIQ